MAGLQFLKTGIWFLGISARNQVRIKGFTSRFYWDFELKMLFKQVSFIKGVRVVFLSEDRRVVVQEIYSLGYLGINRVVSVVVNNFYWRDMQTDVCMIFSECFCVVNKCKVSVLMFLKLIFMSVVLFDFVAVDLMTLIKFYFGNSFVIVVQDYLIKWFEVRMVLQKTV